MAMNARRRATSADTNVRPELGATSASNSAASGGGGAPSSVLHFVPNAQLFECAGGLLFDAAPAVPLSVPAVLRLPSHCSLRAHITVSEWLTAATTAFGFTEAAAMRLFEAASVVSTRTVEQRREQARTLLGKLEEGGGAGTPLASVSPQRAVSLPGLLLLLMAQVFFERAGRTAPGEPPAEAALSFLRAHIHEMVLAVGVTKPGRVAHADLAELRIALREFQNGAEAALGANLGFLWPRGEPTIDCAVVSQLLRQRLALAADVRGALAGNAVHRGLSGGTFVLTSAPPVRASSSFTIAGCAQSSIYVLAPLPSTVLSGLANCLVVLGPVSGMLTVTGCDNCQIVALCCGVVVSNSRRCDLYVCTNTPPILVAATGAGASPASGGGVASLDPSGAGAPATLDGVRIGPYNTFYSALEEHIALTSVVPRLNLFAERVPPSLLMPPTGPDGAGFCPITVPASPPTTNSVTTRTNPCPLPQAYAQASARRAAKFDESCRALQAAYRQLEDAGRRDLADSLRSKVHLSFTDWLVATGQAKGVLDLLHHSQGAATVAAGSGGVAA